MPGVSLDLVWNLLCSTRSVLLMRMGEICLVPVQVHSSVAMHDLVACCRDASPLLHGKIY